MRILIADHDELLVESLESHLLRNGHLAKATSSAMECVSILRNFVPEVIVLDCELRGGGWQGVIAMMAETPRLSRTRTVLVADEDPRDEFPGSLELPYPAWLRKPYRLSDLLDLIENRSHAVAAVEAASNSLVTGNPRSEVQ